MSDVELFWATVCVPFELYRRGERIQVPRDRRHASLAVGGYLLYDPVLTEITYRLSARSDTVTG